MFQCRMCVKSVEIWIFASCFWGNSCPTMNYYTKYKCISEKPSPMLYEKILIVVLKAFYGVFVSSSGCLNSL